MKQQFEGVEDTLFIPLAARVKISRCFPDYFYDAKAVALENLEPVKRINAKSSEYSALASVARYDNMDRFAEAFLKKYPEGNIINLGVGLETMNYRIDPGQGHFYSVDFPEVIALRREILGEGPDETLIGCDLTKMSWTEKVDVAKPALLILSGVFQYFKREAVLRFIRAAQEIFPQGEMVFDATNEVGIRYAQRVVKKTGNKNAMMYFYVNDPKAFARESGTELIESRGFFDKARKMLGKRTKLYSRIAMKVADEKGRTLLVHLKL